MIENRKARYNYELIDDYQCGIVLNGCEIKSLRNGNANMVDSYCVFVGGELYIRNFYIKEYENKGFVRLDPNRDRKLLLKKNELRKLQTKIKEKGLAIIPTKIYINDRGRAKVCIYLAKGKHSYDKKQSIKERDIDRANGLI